MDKDNKNIGYFEVCEIPQTDVVLSFSGTVPVNEKEEFHVSEPVHLTGVRVIIAGGEALWRIALEWENRLADICISIYAALSVCCASVRRTFERYISMVRSMVLRKRPCILRL